MTHYNWIPGSFEEFRLAVREGRLELNITDNQYPWLYANILPWAPHKRDKYEKRLLRRMVHSAEVFRRVHDRGIDLVLHQEPIGDGDFGSDVEGDNQAVVAWTVIGVVAGFILWLNGWHGATIYALPAVAFGAAGAFVNHTRDEPDQIGRWTFPLMGLLWPLALALFAILFTIRIRDRRRVAA